VKRSWEGSGPATTHPLFPPYASNSDPYVGMAGPQYSTAPMSGTEKRGTGAEKTDRTMTRQVERLAKMDREPRCNKQASGHWLHRI